MLYFKCTFRSISIVIYCFILKFHMLFIRLPSAEKMSIKDLKIGIPVEYHCGHLSKEVLETWTSVAKALKQAGAIVKEVTKTFL